jgi:uncharacterized repeat protein (TIGR04076 family)
MPFQVKVTLVAFLGDINRYPCHFCHNVGDELIFDGEKYIGRLCADVWPSIVPKVAAIHSAGPRYADPAEYYPFWYSPLSVKDPSLKKYDGLGFRCVLQTIEEPQQYHMRNLMPPTAFNWPPSESGVPKDTVVLCPDIRSSALFKIEAFDLSEKGHDVPYFRREMVILHKVHAKGSLPIDKILGEFSKQEQEGIYPALSQLLVNRLVEELGLMGYVKVDGDKVAVTAKGKEKLDTFKSGLTQEEVLALGI